MANIYKNTDADEYLSNTVFSGDATDTLDDTSLYWDSIVDYSMYYTEESKTFYLVKDSDISTVSTNDNPTFLGSSLNLKHVSSIHLFKIVYPENSTIFAPGYGDEFLGNSETEMQYQEASRYVQEHANQALTSLQEEGYTNLAGSCIYKGNIYLEEDNTVLDYSFLFPVYIMSIYCLNRVFSCFLYKNGLAVIIENNFKLESDTSEDITLFIEALKKNLKAAFSV